MGSGGSSSSTRQSSTEDSIRMMMSSLAGLFILCFLSGTASGLGSVVARQYSYINDHRTWQDAQSYCRGSNYIDLALLYSQSEVDHMNLNDYDAWIGLYHKTTSSDWVWSDGGNYTVSAWAHDEPQPGEDCASVYYNSGRIYGSICDMYAFFTCHERRPNHYEYTFIPQSKTWSEAQQYCRGVYDDLATIPYSSAVWSVNNLKEFPVWTGLRRDGGAWTWSSGLSEYRRWASGEPRSTSDCVSISSHGKLMSTQSCSDRFPFICFRDNLVLVKENKTWEAALEHCRSLELYDQNNFRYDLVSVQPGDDHTYVKSRLEEAITERVWAGLRFLAGDWLWVNGADMLYSDLPLCPPEGQRCGTLSRNQSSSVEIRDCTEERNFLCYRKW